MKFFVVSLVSLLTLSSAQISRSGHPIAKVIDMLEGLLVKIDFEHKMEEEAYGKFEYWCKTSTADLTKVIGEEKESIETLEDKIAAEKMEMASLEKQMSDLADKIADNEATALKAEKDRANQHALYETEKGNLTETIEAIVGALEAVTGAKNANYTSLVQKRLRGVFALIQRNAKEGHREFSVPLEVPDLEQPPNFRRVETPTVTFDDVLAKGDQKKHVKPYTFKSGGVIELLKGLESDFKQQLLECEQEETNSLNAYDLSKNALLAATAAAEKSKDDKKLEYSAAEKEFDTATLDLKETKSDMEKDSEALKDTTEACAAKEAGWEARSKTREGEVKAMKMAIKILSKVSGVQTEAPVNPIPPVDPAIDMAGPPRIMFLQEGGVPHQEKAHVLSKKDRRAQLAKKAINLLRKTAQGGHSKLIERLAQEVESHLTAPYDDYVFEPVINMIEKMIFHLQEEQKDEDDHKNWCDKELEKTSMMQKDKSDKLDELNAELTLEKTTVQSLTQDIAEATQRIAEITQLLKEATEIRKIGKKENKEALEDANDAQDALAKAIAVLEEFYKESGAVPKEPYESFVQSENRDPLELADKPSTWESSYVGVADPTAQPAGIISVLETTMADFAQMAEMIKENEASDQHEYEMMKSSYEIEAAAREQEVKEKTREKQQRSDNIADLTKEQKRILKEFDKTNQYMTDLQKPCVEADSTYEERKGARDTEIAGLKEAQAILTTAYDEPLTSAFLQVRGKRQVALTP